MASKKSPKILVADDGLLQGDVRASAVRTYALVLARKLRRSLDLVYVEDTGPVATRSPRYQKYVREHVKAQREKLERAAKELGEGTKSLLLEGEPARMLLSLSRKKDAYELIVVGTQGRTGLTRLVLGSVAEEVVRNARLPVFAIGPNAQKGASAFLTSSETCIVVATSLTSNSKAAEHFGIRLAKRLGAKVVFFHTLHDGLHPVLQTAYSVPSPPAQVQALFAEIKDSAVKQLMKKVGDSKKKGVPAEYKLDDQAIASSEAVLKEMRRSKAAFIVMGTHGRSMVSGAFLGRTVRDVVLTSPVPVVTVYSKKA